MSSGPFDVIARKAGAPRARWLVAAAAPLLLLATASRPAASQPRGTVVIDTLWSQSLGIRKQFVVYLPPSYDREPTRRFPVAYYLHGMWGSEWDWVRRGRIDTTMDSLVSSGTAEMILVMPDGDDGWYTTWNSLGNYRQCQRAPREPPASSYCVPWPHYDDYIARDLVAFVDSSYRTLARPEHRGIAGLSMGGFGAVSLAIAYPDVFSAAASHSGTVAPLRIGTDSASGAPVYARTTEELRGFWSHLWFAMEPSFGRDTSGWWARDPGRLARRARESGRPAPALFLDVGVEDRYLTQNRDFRATLSSLEMEVRYAEHPGKHDWTYWRAHVDESLAWLSARLAPR